MAGNITWRTNLGLNNDSVTPALVDWFDSKQQSIDFEGEMFNKYTQYIEFALTPITKMERIDFGHVEKPKYALFRNLTPPGKRPTSIFIAVGMSPVPYDYNDLWNQYEDDTETDSSQSCGGFMPSVAMVFEVPPGQIVGPLILPTFNGFSQYDFDHDLNSNKEAQLYFYAYLGKDPMGGSGTADMATESYLVDKADAFMTYMRSLGNTAFELPVISTDTCKDAIDIIVGNLDELGTGSLSNGIISTVGSYVTEGQVRETFASIEEKFGEIGYRARAILSQHPDGHIEDTDGISEALTNLNNAIIQEVNSDFEVAPSSGGNWSTKAFVDQLFDDLIDKYVNIVAQADFIKEEFHLNEHLSLDDLGNTIIDLCNNLSQFGTSSLRRREASFVVDDFVRSVDKDVIIIRPDEDSSGSSIFPECVWDDSTGWSSLTSSSSTQSSSSKSSSSGTSPEPESSSSGTWPTPGGSSSSGTSPGPGPGPGPEESSSSDVEPTPPWPEDSSSSEVWPDFSSSSEESSSSSIGEHDYGAILVVWAYEM